MNHFIEVNVDDEDCKYLVVHTGSRNLGKQVAEYYQKLAIDCCSGKDEMYKAQERLIELYKSTGRKHLIGPAVAELQKKYKDAHPKHAAHLCYLEGDYRQQYLDDMYTCQDFAVANRDTIASIILDKMFKAAVKDYESFETIHNYISPYDNIIRKGSVSAYDGEELIIPLNMRDGSIIAVGKGNPDWNYSAPHGAGRLMSRSQAKQTLAMDAYKESMDGIFTTSVSKDTLDEAPMAYKPMQEIIDNIGDTVDIINVIKPVYNFKAS